MKMETKGYLILIMGLLLLLPGSLVACYQPESVPVSYASSKMQPPTVDEERPLPVKLPRVNDDSSGEKWSIVETFTGTGNDTTLPFQVSGVKWRITWAIDAEHPEYNTFNFVVCNENKLNAPVENVSSSGSTAGDTIYIYEGGGDYHIRVITANLRRWAIVVEDCNAELSLPPVQITHIHHRGTIYQPDPEKQLCFKRIEPDEYVVIKNQSDSWVDIRGWVLTNSSRGYPSFTFPDYFSCCPSYFNNYSDSASPCIPPAPCILGPHQSVLVYTDEFHPKTGGFSFYYGPGDIWNNEEPEVAVLYNASGEEVSRKSYVVPQENQVLAD